MLRMRTFKFRAAEESCLMWWGLSLSCDLPDSYICALSHHHPSLPRALRFPCPAFLPLPASPVTSDRSQPPPCSIPQSTLPNLKVTVCGFFSSPCFSALSCSRAGSSQEQQRDKRREVTEFPEAHRGPGHCPCPVSPGHWHVSWDGHWKLIRA